MKRPSLNEFPDAATINIVVRTNSRNGANKKRDSRAPSCGLIIKLNLFCINKHPQLALQRAASKRLNLAEVITNWRRYVCTSAEEDCRQKIGESKEVEPEGPAGIPLPLFSNRLFRSLLCIQLSPPPTALSQTKSICTMKQICPLSFYLSLDAVACADSGTTSN